MNKLKQILLISSILILSSPEQNILFAEYLPKRKVTREKWRDGMGFRLIWLEKDNESKHGYVTDFAFPIGSKYDSQKIHFTKSIHPNCEVSKDEYGNISISITNPMKVSSDVPLLLGFVTGIEMYKEAYVDINKSDITGKVNYPGLIKETFLVDDKEYNLSHPLVKQLSSEITSDQSCPIERVKDIWSYINSTMKYRPCPRPNTADQLLEWKKGGCGEFARVTSALLRASKVPAREVHSLILSSGGPRFLDHCWTEAYLPDIGWIPVHSQEEFPEDYMFRLNHRDYFVVYRGTNYKTEHRFLKSDNLVTHCSYGVGYFANVPKSSQLKTAGLLQQLAVSPSMGSGEFFKKIQKLPVESRPVLYWVLSACKDEKVGEKAAYELVKLCQESSGKLILDRFLEFSPSIVWARLMKQGSLVDKDVKTFKGHKYKFFNHKAPWPVAKACCERLGGHLVTISDAEEQDFVAKLPLQLDKDNRVWIGLSDRQLDGKWEWVTGEEMLFQNWAPGLPDNIGGRQDCVEMGYSGSQWNDKGYLNKFAFICEWD